jgi:hypothetical protein
MTDETPKGVTLLKTQQDDYKAAAAQLIRTLEIIVETAPAVARARKTLYDSYIAVGFAHADAVDMCMEMGIN